METMIRVRNRNRIIVMALFSGLVQSCIISCDKDVNTYPQASFSMQGEGGWTFVPCTFTFVNNSTNAIRYEWDFGDGYTSTEKEPIHTYIDSGTFVIKLRAIGESGYDIATDTIILHCRSTAARVTGVHVSHVFKLNKTENIYVCIDKKYCSNVIDAELSSFQPANGIPSYSNLYFRFQNCTIPVGVDTRVELLHCAGTVPNPSTDMYAGEYTFGMIRPLSNVRAGYHGNTVTTTRRGETEYFVASIALDYY